MELSISLQEPITGEIPAITATDDSFAEFYASHHGSIARALGLSLGDAELGSEAADEAMTRACQRWDDISSYDNTEGWVYRVGLNWGRSFLRRRRRMRPSIFLSDQPVNDPPPADPVLAAALRSLDAKHRSVVVMRYYLDWSVETTADALGIKAGTVKSRLNRALNQLERRMGNDRPAPPVTDSEIDLRGPVQ